MPAGELDGRPVTVLVHAFPTVRATLHGLSGRAGQGAPLLVQAARAALDDADLEAIQPIFGRTDVRIPDCLAYDPAWGNPTPEGELELVGAADPERLAAEILEHSPEYGYEAWRDVLRDPAGWIRRYHRALLRIWSALEPFWTRAGAGIERDVERVALAVARGTVPELLAQLMPVAEVSEGSQALRLDDPGLVLQPQLTASRVPYLRRRVGDVLTHVAYPVPSTERLVADPPGPAASLTALLGVPRAHILRELDSPRTQGHLAELLMVVPSAVTRHVAALESAGLVYRQRRGRHVIVHRTARGSAVLDLYEG